MKIVFLLALATLAACSPITTSDQDLLPLNGLTDLSYSPFLGIGAVDITSLEVQTAPKHSDNAFSHIVTDQRSSFFAVQPVTEIENTPLGAEAPVDFLAGLPGVKYMPRCLNVIHGS